MITPYHFKQLLSLCILTTMLAGCATTGDPNQGGLFGWSSAKADQRAVILRSQADEQHHGVESEQRTARRLSRQQSKLDANIGEMNRELNLLLLDVGSVERLDRSGQLSDKTVSIRTRISQEKNLQSPDQERLQRLRRDVELLREEMRLLQQRQ